jgi:hypothetical protein
VRHLRSILYALVLAPAVWILCGVGFDQDLTGRARDNGGIESLFGVLLLVLAGAAYAILLFSPISPAGPLLAGLAFLAVGAWARAAPDSYAGVWPATVADDGFDVSTPGYGLAVLLAVPLLTTALSARRWRAFEPADIVLLGPIGRAGGAAGTPIAEERTTVIPQQRQAPRSVPDFGGSSAEATQIVPPPRRGGMAGAGEEQTTVLRGGMAGAGEEQTTVLRLGPQPAAQEPTQLVPPAAADATSNLSANESTQVVTAAEATADVAAPTQVVTAAEATADVPAPHPASTGEETTREVTADETTRKVTGDETTRLVLPAATDAEPTAAFAATHEDGGEKTQRLTLPKPAGRNPAATDDGERTQVIRAGTVEPPGDRTQLLAFPAPPSPAPASLGTSEAATVETPAAEESAQTRGMSIVAAERPDPGDDPTTRITPLSKEPGRSSTRADPNRRAMTVTNLERPVDEAADDTRPLTLPAQRPPADEGGPS